MPDSVTLKRDLEESFFIPMISVTAAAVRNFLLWNSIGRCFASWSYRRVYIPSSWHPLLFPFLLISAGWNSSWEHTMEEAENQYFQLKLWEKCGSPLRHPLDGNQIHFHFSSKQNCLEPNLPHFWICGQEGQGRSSGSAGSAQDTRDVPCGHSPG